MAVINHRRRLPLMTINKSSFVLKRLVVMVVILTRPATHTSRYSHVPLLTHLLLLHTLAAHLIFFLIKLS